MSPDQIALVANAMNRNSTLTQAEKLAVVAALDFCRTAAKSPQFAVQYGTIAQEVLTAK